MQQPAPGPPPIKEKRPITLLSQATDITQRLSGVHLPEKEKRLFSSLHYNELSEKGAHLEEQLEFRYNSD